MADSKVFNDIQSNWKKELKNMLKQELETLVRQIENQQISEDEIVQSFIEIVEKYPKTSEKHRKLYEGFLKKHINNSICELYYRME